MTSKLMVAIATAGLVGLTSDFADAQQKGGKNTEAMAAKCRAQVAKALPGGDISMKTQKQRMFKVCMQNGGKL